MSSISRLSSPIRDGYLSSRSFNKPVVAIVAIACAIVIAVGIYLLKRSGYSLGFAPQFQRRTPDSPSTNLQITPQPIVPQSTTPQQPLSHRERMNALPTPVLEKDKYQDIKIDVPFRGEASMTVPGPVIYFAEQAKAAEIQRIAPNVWLINCHTHGYFISGDGKEIDRCDSPTPHAERPQGASKQILFADLLARVQRQ